MEPLVSIIVPVYNKEKYLISCLNSIIEQEYKNIEVILVDDGSTDKSGEICDIYATKDDRIQVAHQCNQGVSVARNQGIKMATGVYICFWDSDDVMYKNLLTRCIPQMINQKLDLLYFNIACRAEEGDGYWNKPVKEGFTEFKEPIERLSFVLDEFMNYNLAFFCGNKIYCRENIVQHNLQFDVGVRMGEDLGFNVKYLLSANRICGISDVLYEYWKRKNSAMDTGGKTVICIDDFSRMLEEIRKYYRNTYLPIRKFRKLFIKIMDNQYEKRRVRSEYNLFVALVQNKKWLLYMTGCMLIHPEDFIALYGMSVAKVKWKDHVYILYYLLVSMRKERKNL